MSDNLNNLFQDLQGHFDTEEPVKDHEKRFLSKLNEQNTIAHTTTKQRFNWKPLIGIAASVVLIIASLYKLQLESLQLRDLLKMEAM